MKTIILCGGKGTRLREETEFKPKPMVKIGDFPILVHIMKIYAHYGYKDFILCLGYRGDSIKDYFLNLSKYINDFKYNPLTGSINYLNNNHDFDFNIIFAETGEDTTSGDRVKIAAEKYVGEDEFMVTYGDGVSDIDINKLVEFHRQQKEMHGIFTTISAVHPSSKYGKIYANEYNLIKEFYEKPMLNDYINGGFMVMHKNALNYIQKGDMLEDALKKKVKDLKLCQYAHDGFWHSLDTIKDVIDLNNLWKESRPWAVWEKNSGLGN